MRLLELFKISQGEIEVRDPKTYFLSFLEEKYELLEEIENSELEGVILEEIELVIELRRK